MTGGAGEPSARVAGRRAIRLGGLSGVWRPRPTLVTLVGAGLVLLVALANIGRGEFPLTLGEVFTALLGGGDRAERFIVLRLRLPRTATGLLVGAALGLAGAITQRLARNPLASPDLLGVTAGASASAVALIALGGSSVLVGPFAAVGLPTAALVGGLSAAALVYALTYRGRDLDGGRLVLVGVGVSAVGTAISSWLLMVADLHQAATATVWLTGSLNARDWAQAIPLGIVLAVLLPLSLLLAFGLGALRLGDDTARALGVRVGLLRAALALVALLLAAAATAAAGPVAFVALVVPHICQRLAGMPEPPLLTAACYGALLVLAADLISRTMLPTELPVGIITAVLGAPYLLYLLVRANRRVNV